MTESTIIKNKDERTFAMLCHLSSFSGMVFPLGNILGPLLIWLIKKEDYSLVDDQGKESLNFQISWSIYMLISAVLSILLIGIPLLFGLMLYFLIIVIVASIKANDGIKYRYPFTIRFIS